MQGSTPASPLFYNSNEIKSLETQCLRVFLPATPKYINSSDTNFEYLFFLALVARIHRKDLEYLFSKCDEIGTRKISDKIFQPFLSPDISMNRPGLNLIHNTSKLAGEK